MRKYSVIFLLILSLIPLQAAHLGFLMPSGARQGTTVDVIIGGQAFWGVSSAIISGGGVEVESVQVVRWIPHPDSRQRIYIRKQLDNFHKGIKTKIPKPENTETWRKHEYFDRLDNLTDCERDILYRFLFVPQNSLQASPAIASRVIIRLKIAPDAEVGEREFRLLERNGRLSNPMKFYIGKAPEFREEFFPYPPAVQKPVTFTIPGTLNGQIMPGETDTFKFHLKKGETVTFKLLGRHLNPFVGDGVPGHFQAVMAVLNKKNKVLAFADDYFFDPDPILTFKAPEDGEYTLLIRDAIYRGRADFVYRVTASYGTHPLPDAPAPNIPGVPVVDAEKLEDVRQIKYPIIIKGMITREKGDSYPVKLKKGETVVLEMFSRRLGLPPDGVIKVYDKSDELIAYNDDTDRLKAGLILHNSADPLLIFKAPENGIYRINVSDNAGFFGDAYKYYLRIDRKRKLFDVYATPSTMQILSDSCSTLKLTVQRYDNYNGEIKLRVKSPAGIRIVGIDSIPPGTNSAVITLDGKYDKKKPLLYLELEAYTDEFSTKVVPGDEMMQAFAYTHINPAKTFPIRVPYRTSRAEWADKNTVYTIAPGQTIKLKIKQLPLYPSGDPVVSLTAVNLPPWLKVVPQKNSAMKVRGVKQKNNRIQKYLPPLEIVLQATPEAAGKATNLVFELRWEQNSKPDKNGKVRVIKQKLILPALQIRVQGK